MARHEKNTVDYFPHNCNGGKTMFILESKYRNDGYAFWFKILELLGSNENHFIDCRNPETWEFMLAKTLVSEETANNILATLSNLNAINKELWSHKIIFSDNFIKNLEEVYKRRNSKCMQKYDLCKHLKIKCKHKSLSRKSSDTETDKVKYSKVNESKVNQIKTVLDFPLLNNEVFKKSFEEWGEFRKEIKHKLTPSMITKQLEFLNKQPDPIACINKSIQQGWQGLFEVNNKNNGFREAQSKNGIFNSVGGIKPPVDKQYKTAKVSD